jgi:hypothetical protein
MTSGDEDIGHGLEGLYSNYVPLDPLEKGRG